MTKHELKVLVTAILAAPGDWSEEAFELAAKAADRLIAQAQ